VAKTPAAAIKINNLEDIHCVWDAGVANSNPATKPKAHSLDERLWNGRSGRNGETAAFHFVWPPGAKVRTTS
jgi:hypothetical protein